MPTEKKGQGSQGKSTENKSGSQESKRGFAAMDEAQQREIASQGGKAAHQKGTAHEFDSEEARRAGQKGGETVSQDREHMAEIGRKGGESTSKDRAHMADIGAKGGERSHESSSRDTSREDEEGGGKSTRGGTPEQHAKAGSQSHKNK